jgi:hypothetical protein
MDDSELVVVETRSRARNTGHAFGFSGNLGLPFILSVLVSVMLLTVSMGWEMALEIKLLQCFSPAIGTTLYLLLCRVGRPPNWDIDCVRTLILGRGFKASRLQPVHPLMLYRAPDPRGEGPSQPVRAA